MADLYVLFVHKKKKKGKKEGRGYCGGEPVLIHTVCGLRAITESTPAKAMT